MPDLALAMLAMIITGVTMHLHRYRGWDEYETYDQRIDGKLAYTVTVWLGRCEVCGKPKRRKIKH